MLLRVSLSPNVQLHVLLLVAKRRDKFRRRASSHTKATPLHTCLLPCCLCKLFCSRTQAVEVYSQERDALILAELLPQRPHQANTLLRRLLR